MLVKKINLVDHPENDDRRVSQFVDENFVGVTELLRGRLSHLRQRRSTDGLAKTTNVPFAEKQLKLHF
jgi:hypothetical protein